MVYRGDIGNISHRQVVNDFFNWTIGNLLLLLHTTNIEIVSPVFHYENQQCALGLKTFEKGDRNEEWIGMTFWILPKIYDIDVKLGILSSDGEESMSFRPQRVDSDDLQIPLYEQPQFLRRSEATRYLDAGQLTVFCEIQKTCSERKIILEERDTFDGILAA